MLSAGYYCLDALIDDGYLAYRSLTTILSGCSYHIDARRNPPAFLVTAVPDVGATIALSFVDDGSIGS